MEKEAIYKSRIDNFKQKQNQLKSKLLRLSLLRLAIFLGCTAGIYFFWSTTLAVVGFILGFIISFIVLVKIHAAQKRALQKTKLLININQKEIKALHGDISSFDDGKIYKDASHAFADDIDLFGEQSLFQFINRTGLLEGRNCLANLLKSNDCKTIFEKQKAIKDLSKRLDFRQNYTAEAQMLSNEEDLSSVLKALQQHKRFIPKVFYPISLAFSFMSMAVIGLYAFEIIGEMQLLFWIFTGLGITGVYLKKINRISQITAKTQELFRQYHKLILAVENEEFESDFLKAQQSKLKSEQKNASQAIKDFSNHIDALEQRQNMIVGFVLNALSLWDLRQCYKIENWLSSHQKQIYSWFETMGIFDAYNSLANLAYNQVHFAYPKLLENKETVLDCKSSTHPLIPSSQAVVNDFKIQNESFLIITGANMAGKSTFLRTVSLMIVMANAGLPVCAEECQYSPIKLITSMRTTDSLSSESSYFFSELSRLKTIVEHIQNDKYFILLDEILKGTNSHDKAKGSKQFVERLVKSQSTGIIATHDLSLCSLADELKQVKNFYFDAEIISDELSFDYKYKKGICQNMNASFLLKKMGIV
jgi:DNA mismatch repair ATPase MutS